jgi:hypothetical protein
MPTFEICPIISYLEAFYMGNIGNFIPGPLNGVILDGVGIDGTDHLSVVSRTDHHVTRDIRDAEIGSYHIKSMLT